MSRSLRLFLQETRRNAAWTHKGCGIDLFAEFRGVSGGNKHKTSRTPGAARLKQKNYIPSELLISVLVVYIILTFRD